MVRKSETTYKPKHKDRIKADVIILGCSLPGIVTAHKLKKKFGNSMDIMVLDLIGPARNSSKCNVAFQEVRNEEEEGEHQDDTDIAAEYKKAARLLADNVARFHLSKFAKDFNVPLPAAIMEPERVKNPLNKLFQHRNGATVQCVSDYHDFDYLCLLEKFELNQYQCLLDQSMKDLFQMAHPDTDDRKTLRYYDQTTMERHICDALLFPTSREIMRMTVRLVCGAPTTDVSVLFYLHQCYRTSSSRNHLDGDNTRFREKLLGYCRKRLALKLQQSVADITLEVKHNIKEIRTCPDEQVILETMKGETTYVCNLLAMALKPDELHSIRVEKELMSDEDTRITKAMKPGRAKKFLVQYEENFWSQQGYSGDILSIRGPIIWAMERPKMSTTGSTERYPALIGYLMTLDDEDRSSRTEVLEQLVKLFGEDAATPVSYRETNVADVFVPHCGDYVALRRMICHGRTRFLEWASLDVFADGDVAAALEAGHIAYLHLLSCLRPQAQTYEDMSTLEPTFLVFDPLPRFLAHINCISCIKWSIYVGVTVMALRYFRSLMKR